MFVSKPEFNKQESGMVLATDRSAKQPPESVHPVSYVMSLSGFC